MAKPQPSYAPPLSNSWGGASTPSTPSPQMTINEANATFTCQPTQHPQTVSPLQHWDNRNPQTKEDLAEEYLGKSNVEVLLNAKLLEDVDQLAKELENMVDVGQLPFPAPHPSFIPQPSPGPQITHLPPHMVPKAPPSAPPNPVQQLVQVLMAIGQNIPQPPHPGKQPDSGMPLFDSSNSEDLRMFLLQCQITFNSYIPATVCDAHHESILHDQLSEEVGTGMV